MEQLTDQALSKIAANEVQEAIIAFLKQLPLEDRETMLTALTEYDREKFTVSIWHRLDNYLSTPVSYEKYATEANILKCILR